MTTPLKTIDLTRLYTTREFMSLPLDQNKRYQLVRGVIEEMSWPGGKHGLVCDNLYSELTVFVRANKLGRLVPPTGFELKIDPQHDTVRSPDLAFIPTNLLGAVDKKAITVSPGLAVEVLSPSNRPGETHEKLQDYQMAGWDLVWVIDPDKQKAEVYRLQQSLNPLRVLSLSDSLDGEDVIPGFTMPVQALFE